MAQVMRLIHENARLNVRNYRTLESLNLAFPSFYSAICGRNDSGKTNVVTAIKRLVQQEGRRYYGYPHPEKPEFFFKDDFTKWVESKPKRRRISVSVELLIDAARDAGVYSLRRPNLAEFCRTFPRSFRFRSL